MKYIINKSSFGSVWQCVGVLAWLALWLPGQVHAACSPAQILRDDVLIVVNMNSVDSPRLGDYYCEQRGIDPRNIAPVYVPDNRTMQLDQFVSLRDQLIRFLQENTLTGSEPLAVCATAQGYTRYYCPETVDQVRRLSRIRYLVTTKGIPVEFKYEFSPLSQPAETSVDNYLRFWLLNYFAQDQRFAFYNRAAAFQDGRGMRTVDPLLDRELVVGRIDGITLQGAMQLVDRALAAERNGIYGKNYSSKFESDLYNPTSDGAYWKSWLSSGGRQPVYPYSRYIYGLFGALSGPGVTGIYYADLAACVTYDSQGLSPQDCVTRLTEGATMPVEFNDPGPGGPTGHIPLADHALVYMGYVDGEFSTFESFDTMLNWRNDASCNTLCDANDAVCRAASTDAYREIDTRCVGVAEGFIGYNYRSYPVGMMAGSPTDWFVSTANGPDHWFFTGGPSTFMWNPEVREDTGYDDNYSLWFRLPDAVPGARCYAAGDDLSVAPAGGCNQAQKSNINQRVMIPERAIDTLNPQSITIRFKYRALDLSRNLDLRVRLYVHESVYQDASVSIEDTSQVDYGRKTAALITAPDTPADRNSWADAVVTFTLDPALHRHPQLLIDGFRFRIESVNDFAGQLAIDTVSADIDGVNVPLGNPTFADGHRQLSGGDSAASFLGRLNGTAFWANITHHESNGHSFDSHPYETLIYFLRGLPLGDAVWFAEDHNSGILYGDPLYSPIAVHLHYLSGAVPGAAKDTFDLQVPLSLRGDTLNGTGSDVVTTWSVSYCPGRDFYLCDQAHSWVAISNMQDRPGGARDMALGDWDVRTLAPGGYTLRLAVTSFNSTSGNRQTFNDYYPLTLQTGVAPSGGGGGGTTAAGGGGGGCALRPTGAARAIDPLLWGLLLLAAVRVLGRSRRRIGREIS